MKNKIRRHRRHWTEEETNQLRELWRRGKSRSEIARMLSRKVTAIIIRARSLGLMPTKHPWLPHEVKYIKQYYKTKPIKELADIVNHSYGTIVAFAHRLGIRKFRRWTADEDRYLRAMYRTDSPRKIAKHLNRTASSVSRRLRVVGLVKKRPFRFWTQQELEFFRKNFMTMSFTELARHFNRTYWAIGQKAFRLGLIKRKVNQ